MSGVPPARLSYTKTWLSVPDQVVKLQARGLQIPDLVDAESFLYHVSYYSFAGYCLAFENPRHSFPVGVTFEQIKFAYIFDMTLRDLLNEALELIEIDLCTSVAYSFGHVDWYVLVASILSSHCSLNFVSHRCNATRFSAFKS